MEKIMIGMRLIIEASSKRKRSKFSFFGYYIKSLNRLKIPIVTYKLFNKSDYNWFPYNRTYKCKEY